MSRSIPPLISVVIPVFNRGPRIRATVDSAVGQILPAAELEIILVDDGSTDGTAQILHQEYGDHPAVRIIHQARQGVAGSRNRGLAEAKGEYIAYLDHDDRWLPVKLDLQFQEMLRNPAAALVYSGWKEVNDDGRALPDSEQMQRAPWWQPHTGRVYGRLLPRNFIVSASVPLLRTEAVRRVGGWDPQTVPVDDYDLWLRLARRFEFACVPEELVLYTRHPGQQSGDSYAMHQALYRTLRKQWRYLIFHPKKLWFLTVGIETPATARLFARAKECLTQGDSAGARAIIAETARVRPLVLVSPRWLVLLRRLATGNSAAYR